MSPPGAALERSEADVALSLIAFGRLFDNLSNPFDRGPFADDVEPPPFPDRRPEDGGRTQTRGKGPPPGGMSMPLVGNFDERNAAVLESVLALYDKFAERNETDSKLQGEAARAYRKVAAIYRMIGRQQDAEAAYSRSLHRFELLAAQHPSDADYRYELRGPSPWMTRTESMRRNPSGARSPCGRVSPSWKDCRSKCRTSWFMRLRLRDGMHDWPG